MDYTDSELISEVQREMNTNRSFRKDIEKAILQSELGITPNIDGKVIRLSVPPLSEERRDELIKVVKKVAEEGRISIRTIRRDAKDKIKTLEKDKAIYLLLSRDLSTCFNM